MEMAPDGVATHKMKELQDLMSRQPIDRKRGPVEDKISKLLVCGGQQMHGAQIKIAEIRRSLKDFVRQQEEGMEFARNN